MRRLTMKLAMTTILLLTMAPVASAIEFQWKDEAGGVKSLADYKGKPVILHFWASWCPPCREEMPRLQAWRAKHHDVALVVVSMDRNIDDAEAFLKSKGLPFPALQGALSDTQKMGVRGLPTTVVIGADGSVVKVRTGAVNWESASDGGAILAAAGS